LPYDLYLNISSFLLKSDIIGFIQSCRKTSTLLLWMNDDAGVHICLGMDLTCSMDSAYSILKPYLLDLLIDLKRDKENIGRTLFSSFFYWDLDRSYYENEPYVQIQPPAESIFKQEKLISDALIASGGGPECGGIALCELEAQFKNRWISQHTGNFSKSMDIIVLLLDAPFHFLVDDESYYEVTRKHSIKHDWISAIHNLCNKGVLIIMICINTQNNFKKPLRLIGGMIDALGGYALEITTDGLKNIPIFIKSIIKEETQKRKIIHTLYKSIAYKYKYMSTTDLDKIMENELSKININIDCANIPSKNRIYSNDVDNSRELAKCKTMVEAISKGLLESEAVMKRLYFKNNDEPANIACVSSIPQIIQSQITNDFDFGDDIPPMAPMQLIRQQSCAISTSINRYSQTPKNIMKQSTTSGNSPDVQKIPHNVSIEKIKSGCALNTFGLCRRKSMSMNYSPNRISNIITESKLDTIDEYMEECENKQESRCIIEGSIKCYLREPNIDLSSITDPLLNLVNSTDETKFRKLLLEQNPNQYNLYINGGVLERFKQNTDRHINRQIIRADATFEGGGLIMNNIPTMSRSFSENADSNLRILKFIRSNSTM